jgi:hypothetical protein
MIKPDGHRAGACFRSSGSSTIGTKPNRPFAALPRRTVGLDGVGKLLRDMAGEGDTPPVHGVVVLEMTS